MPSHTTEQRIPFFGVLSSNPYGDHGPRLKRPAMYEGDLDATLVAQICALLIADASLARPRGNSTWWHDKDALDVAEAEEAFRAVVAANPKVLKIDDRRSSQTPALYLVRIGDCVQIASIYTGPVSK